MKIIKSILVSCVVGFAVGFAEEIILSATKADESTRNKVHKTTDAVLLGVAIGSLIV